MTAPPLDPDRSLSERDVDPDPITQFAAWYEDARSAGVSRPDAMALATASTEATPSVRVVLLKGFDRRGLVFYSNFQSRKGRDLESNPRAAVAFHWIEQHRQVRVEGTVARLSAEESDRYFASRPRDAQLAARASPQSDAITDREALDRRFDEEAQAFLGRDVVRPETWGGYRLAPDSMEFWQGRPNRLHDRLRYSRRPDGGWTVERLAP